MKILIIATLLLLTVFGSNHYNENNLRLPASIRRTRSDPIKLQQWHTDINLKDENHKRDAKFTIFCNKDNLYKKECKNLIHHVYKSFVCSATQCTSKTIHKKLQEIESKLTRPGKCLPRLFPRNNDKTVICGIQQKMFDKSDVPSLEVYQMNTIHNDDLKRAIKQSKRRMKRYKGKKTAHFIIGPSATGKSTTRDKIAGAIKSIHKNSTIFAVDGDDFREGDLCYQTLIKISRAFNCGDERNPERCVYRFWEMEKFANLKEEYYKELYHYSIEQNAHLIITQTPRGSASWIMNQLLNNEDYQIFLYKHDVSLENIPYIEQAGLERGEKTGKEYNIWSKRKFPYWKLWFSNHYLWSNDLGCSNKKPECAEYIIKYKFVNNAQGF